MPRMGRKRTSDFDLPPRLHRKGESYYYVANTKPRKWLPLGKDLSRAKVLWAQYEGEANQSGSFIKGLTEWYASKRFDRLSDATKKAYNKVRGQLEEFFNGADYNSITPQHIAQWLDNHASPVNANIGRAVVSNVFEVALRTGEAFRNPCKDMPGLIIEGRTRYMTDDEFTAIRDQANDVVKACMDIGYLTGMRITDILNIKLSDIRDGFLYVTQHKTEQKQRYELLPALQAAIDSAKSLPRPVRNMTYLLCTRKGEPYRYDVINRAFWKAKKEAGISDVRFHDIRAKSATDAKELGINYQALLGHASQAMSDKYIRRYEFVKANPLPRKL